MKAYQTVAWADEFIDEIKELSRTGGPVRSVGVEINDRMCDALLTQLRNGRMNERLFEKFVRALLERLGCSNVKLVPRIVDKGADIVGYHDALGISVVAQVKFHRDKKSPTGRECIDELQKGMAAASTNVGWAVTLGEFNEEAQHLAEKLKQDENLSIRLIDGDELVKLAIEYGVPMGFDEA
jgi:HJR/Mrr/RecB family endonuclease